MAQAEMLREGTVEARRGGAIAADGATPCRSILMVGTHLGSTGGVRAVVQGYLDAGLFERFEGAYVATHRSGGPWIKIRFALSGWLRIAIALFRLDAPLVHVMLASRASFWRKSVVCLMARAAGRPYLLHVHGAEFDRFYHCESGALTRRFVRYIFAHAALVIALSEQWRGELRRVYPHSRIEVLHNAVPLPDPVARASAAHGNAETILFLGELGRRKGTHDLLLAFSRIAADRPRMRLVCAGDGDIDGSRALAAQLGIQDRAAFPGWLEADRKRAALAGATIFALPSYAEGMPMALLDAMAWGIPVVTSTVGGIPQVVQNELNGLLVTPGDIDAIAAALVRLVEDAPLRARLGHAARATIEREFSLDAAIERLTAIYARFGLEPARHIHSTGD
jgi:glycosyltransferase involved in cell wall biosynthesis